MQSRPGRIARLALLTAAFGLVATLGLPRTLTPDDAEPAALTPEEQDALVEASRARRVAPRGGRPPRPERPKE